MDEGVKRMSTTRGVIEGGIEDHYGSLLKRARTRSRGCLGSFDVGTINKPSNK